MAARSSRGITPPVGFCGELRTTNLVRGGEQAREAVHVEGEAAALFERHRDRRRAAEPDHGFVDRETGIGVDGLVAGFEQREHGEEDHRLAAGNDADVLRAHLNAARAGDVRGDGLAQFGESLGGAVVGPALIERVLAGLDDVGGRREIGLTDFEVNDALALGFQRAGADQDLKRLFHADSGHSLCKFHG